LPPVVLEIIVNADKGIAELRQLDKALSDTTKATQQQSQAQTQATQSTARARDELGRFVSTGEQATKSSQGFSSSLAQSAKSAAGLAAGFAGVAGIATTLSAAATAATGFEAALNAISALGTVSTGQLSKLREQLLALPPALGSSTELAKGLYDILGANVPADNAITVLAQSAELAKGGLGNLDTAINVVTKSAAAFGIPLSESQMIVDTLTQTVVRGQGRLEEFANAFPQVTQTAAATGVTFKDTNAAMAVLTQTFKNADTAATGLNSFLAQLIQNSAKLAAEGINVKQVLAEEGLTGIFQRLNEVTGGSAERLKILINDSEGFRAASALSGAQLATFIETVGSYNNITGLAHQAATKNLSGAGAAWTTFLNTLDRLVQEVAPPLLSAFAAVTGAAATLAADVTKLWRAFTQSETLRTITADLKTFLGVLGETSVVQGFVTSLKDLNDTLLTAKGSTDQTYNAFEVLDQLLKGNIVPTIDFVKGAWDLMNAVFNATVAIFLRFGKSVVQVVTPLAEIVAALDQTATKLGLSDGRFSKLGETAKTLSTNLEDAAVIFDEQAQGFVLGTHRMGNAQDQLGTQLGATTGKLKDQAQTLPGQEKAAAGAAAATAQLTESQQAAKAALDAANVSATAYKGALEKLKPGDILSAMPTRELAGAVAIVTQSLEKMAASGKFSAREIQQAYEDAAQVMRDRFGELPAAFAKSQDRFLEQTRQTADGILLIFQRLGIHTKEEQQKSATQFAADVAALLGKTRTQAESTLALTKDVFGRQALMGKEAAEATAKAFTQAGSDVHKATAAMGTNVAQSFEQAITVSKDALGTLVLSNQTALTSAAADFAATGKQLGEITETITDSMGQSFTRLVDVYEETGKDITTITTVTVHDQITLLHEMVERINKGEFKQLPEGWDAALAQLGPIAQRNGEGVVKIFRDVNGNIQVSLQETASAFKAHGFTFEQVFAAVTAAEITFGNTLRDHLSPAIIDAAERMGLLAQRTGEAEVNTRGLSETAIMLGHHLNELGQEVNAYGLEVARVTEQTQRLLDLRIDVRTPFAEDLAGLQRQLQQANADLLALGRRIPELGYEGYRQQQRVLLDLIAELDRRIAALRQTASGSTTGGSTTGGTTTTGGSTTGGSTNRPTQSGGGGSTFITQRQHGGPVWAGQPYLVGERGPEVVVPRQSGTVLPAGQTGTSPRSITYNLTIYTQAQDAATLARDLVPLLRQADLSPRRMGG
jgi:TP901 family phage tail tape measure protein